MKVNPTAATGAAAASHSLDALPSLLAATAHALPEQADTVARARAFAKPLIGE